MTSPLAAYANAYALVAAQGIPTVINGRIVSSASDKYLLKCYLVRQQSTGTTTGADDIPTSSGDLLPGISGSSYLYRGYCLGYVNVASDYELSDGVPTGAIWTEITSMNVPSWLAIGITCEHLQGYEYVKHATIKAISGKYGNAGIDVIINQEIGGIPIVLKSGEVIN